jgi:membrane-associated phospholipid phosphatase
MYKNFLNLLSIIGQNGPIILFALSVFLLRNKCNLLFYYITFYVIGLILNIILKGIIQQPRPSIDKKTFDLMIKNKERYISKYGIPYDIYGMPSGHSQSVLFSTIFIYFAFHNTKLTIIYLLISIITVFQRVIQNHHTVLQVIVGSMIGLIIGYVSYEMAKLKMAGKLTNKKDDYARI